MTPMKQKLGLLSSIHVLVVDDYEDTRDLMKSALEYFGVLVSLASSAREGLWKFQQVTPDVILVDLGMPVEDGYWFIKEIQKLEQAHGRVRTIAFTAYGKEEHEQTALAAGFDRFVEKPVDLDDLCNAIKKLTTPKRAARAS